MTRAEEIRNQINEWCKQRDNIEDMIEEGYKALDEAIEE